MVVVVVVRFDLSSSFENVYLFLRVCWILYAIFAEIDE